MGYIVAVYLVGIITGMFLTVICIAAKDEED